VHFYQTAFNNRSPDNLLQFSTREPERLEFLRVPLRIYALAVEPLFQLLAGVFAKEIADHTLALYVDDAILAHFSFSGHMDQLRHIFQKLRTA
jgi:hypothetical protein